MSLAYLLWGAFFLFSPGRVPPYGVDLPRVIDRVMTAFAALYHPGELSQYPSVWHQVRRWNWEYSIVWHQVRRWNWGLLALFYAALLVEGLVSWRHFREHRGHVDVLPKRPRIPMRRLITLILWWGVLIWIARNSPGWAAVIGVASLAIIAAITWDWRRITRSAGRLMKGIRPVVPAIGIGMGVGLLWSWCGPLPALCAALPIIAGSIVWRWPEGRERRLRAAAFILAVYYGFSVSAHVVNTPVIAISGKGPIQRTVKPGMAPPTVKPGIPPPR